MINDQQGDRGAIAFESELTGLDPFLKERVRRVTRSPRAAKKSSPHQARLSQQVEFNPGTFKSGTFKSDSPVVYWTHHALRVDENPALDVAIHFAKSLGRPLFVYQGLSSSYRYASDRHHVFQLQGSKDLAEEYSKLGIRYELFVETREDTTSALFELCKQTDCLITEDFPGEPTDRWLERLSYLEHLNLFAVDTACVVPMQLVGKAYDRAFAFRDATQKLYRERISRPWPAMQSSPRYYQEALPFEPVDCKSLEPLQFVSRCDIDPTVAPVGDTLGGTRAGYARWNAFLERGIRKYAAKRNDPCAGVSSRMSAYLHYGMVSPMRLAREAHALGAEKYLDELLIWRELAYAYCFYRKEHNTLRTLPTWAQETLRKHTADAREAIYSWERLARGKTKDALWNACQRSLLKHGELHNNVRMTWGKAVAQWTKSPEDTLRMLIDLNHRYALDGRDPASYGGILWCLGEFDRPFQPEQEVLGTVRGRSTNEHFQRIDFKAFEKHVDRPVGSGSMRIAVVGAGIGGLFCARTLKDYGAQVSVFDKSRGVGGRMATRRISDGLLVDHGPAMMQWDAKESKHWVEAWELEGVLHRWQGKVISCENNIALMSEENGAINAEVPIGWVGGRGMSDLAKHFATDLSLVPQTQIQSLRREGEHWFVSGLTSEIGDGASSKLEKAHEAGPFDAVVLNMPPVQCAALLGKQTWDAIRISQDTHAEQSMLTARSSRPEDLTQWLEPVWAVILGFKERWDMPFDGIRFKNHEVLEWMGRESSKPGRLNHDLEGKTQRLDAIMRSNVHQGNEYWVIHSNSNWAEAHLELTPQEVADRIRDAVREISGDTIPEIIDLQAHRWRYARVRGSSGNQRGQVHGNRAWWSSEQRVGVCGDWVQPGSSGIQGALYSGGAMAGYLLREWVGRRVGNGTLYTPELF